MILILTINQQLQQPDLFISKQYLTHHLKQLKHWRGYNAQQFKHWLAHSPDDPQIFKTILQAYLMAFSVPALSPVKTDYYCWLYDAYSMCYD